MPVLSSGYQAPVSRSLTDAPCSGQPVEVGAAAALELAQLGRAASMSRRRCSRSARRSSIWPSTYSSWLRRPRGTS